MTPIYSFWHNLFLTQRLILRWHPVFLGGPLAQIDQLAAFGAEGLEFVFRPPLDGLAAGGAGDGFIFLSHRAYRNKKGGRGRLFSTSVPA